MDNLETPTRIKILLLACIVFILVPISYSFYSKNEYAQDAQSLSFVTKKVTITNIALLNKTLPNNTSTLVVDSISSYLTDNNISSNPWHVVSDKIETINGTYRFFLANKNEDQQFRVDVVIAGFDTTKTYINGVVW